MRNLPFEACPVIPAGRQNHPSVKTRAKLTTAPTRLALAGAAAAAVYAGVALSAHAQGGPDYISGSVVNAAGEKPEAGVWVVAETDDLATPYRKIVVTNDDGKFVLPDLPKATYHVWVRGYGLTDSKPMDAKPGADLKLQAASAASPQEAASIYPAQYWLSLYQPPANEELPAAFPAFPGMPLAKSDGRDMWVAEFKLTCMLCHQLGTVNTRQNTSPEDWEKIWHRAGFMNGVADGLKRDVLKASLVDWSKRIATGETPDMPPRPAGVERNVVITEWQWGEYNSYVHDEVATDKRNPSLYPYGPVWGIDIGTDTLWKLDVKTNTVSAHHVPVRGNYNKNWNESFSSWSVYPWVANPHNPMLDDKNHVWITTQIRDKNDQPKWEKDVLVYETGYGSVENTEGEPPSQSGRQLGYLDVTTEKWVLINTVYGTHHLQFDAQGRLWTSLDLRGLGMFDPSKLDPANPEGTEAQAQKLYIKQDPKTGQYLASFGYGIAVNPVDQTIWRANPFPGGAVNEIMKFDPKTGVHTEYPLPLPARGPRGIDATTDGRIWFATGSGHLGRFDPATQKFTYWELPGPKMKQTGPETGSAEMPYYIWVDQFNTFGMGKDVVITCGTNSDSMVTFDPVTEKFNVIRVPYPLSFYTRGLDGRIDDANAGWKGRGLWADYGEDPIRFVEHTQRGAAVHIQMRPDPLTR
jgi:hypothetical protein